MRKSLMSCSLLEVSFDVGVSVEEDFTSIVRDSSSMISSRTLLAGAATVMVLAFFDVGVLALTTGFAGFLELRVESPSIDLFSFILDYKHEETVELFKVRMLDASEEEKTILLKAAEILGLDLD